MSGKFTPATLTDITISLSPGFGEGASSYFNDSGVENLWHRIAYI